MDAQEIVLAFTLQVIVIILTMVGLAVMWRWLSNGDKKRSDRLDLERLRAGETDNGDGEDSWTDQGSFTHVR